MTKILKAALLAAVTLSAAHALGADVVTKEGTGSAAIVGGKKEEAFKEAEKNALRNAVEQAAGVFIQADTVTQNSQLLVDRVYANATGYVKKWDVVSKKEDDKGRTVTVTVKADVGTEKLDQDIIAVQGLVKRMGRTKLIIVMNEQSIDEKGVSTKSETLATALTDSFKKQGWNIIDEKSTGDSLKLSSGAALGVPEAKEVARKSDADYVIYGTTTFRYQVGREGDMVKDVYFVTGEYDATMFEVQTGRQLSKVAGKFDQALMIKLKISPLKSYAQTAQDLCKGDAPRIVGELQTPALEYLRNQDLNGAQLVMKVNGLKSYGEVSEFEKAMGQLANVAEVSANGDYANGKQVYEVKYRGKPSELGRAIEVALFKKKKISVLAVKNNEVEVAIAK